MKKHLRILYGCDDRFELTRDTVKVSLPYFDSISILNVGPFEFYDRLRNELPNSVIIRQFNGFLEMESSRRALLSDVPYNDWVLWLDADERPTPELLLNIDNCIEESEKGNYEHIRLIWTEHCEGKCIKFPIIKNMEEFKKTGSSLFCPKRFIKKMPGYYLSTHFGAHEEFNNSINNGIYMPFYMNHLKSYIQYCQSVVFSSFANPLVHINCPTSNDIYKIITHPDFQKFKNFKIKYKVFTSNDIVKKIKIEKDEKFICDIKELFLSFSDEIIGFKFMKMFVEKYDLNVNSPHFICGESCCKYNDIQL